MMNLCTFVCISVFFIVYTVAAPSFIYQPTSDTSRETQTLAVRKLIIRLIGPALSEQFSVQITRKNEGSTDELTLLKETKNVVRITGTSGVAAAYGFHFYLKNFCNCHISWDYDQLALPSELPFVNITVKSPDRFRYYQNVCTASYSFAWWTWTRWEREIDWMALNGINLALAFTAQEVIWSRVYKEFNLTDSDINEHFTGPAFLAWGRMANIRGWGGPLSESWLDFQLSLQHKILRRMKNLGIKPILPAFCGHVPRAFKRIFPSAKLTMLSTWNNFQDKYCCPYILEPDEPLFVQVGQAFYRMMKNEFGITHYYNCDLFNELAPPNSSLSYLKDISSRVSTVLLQGDPDAVWIMQGWLFASNAAFWTLERIEHFLSGVPNDKMIILDLQSEFVPLYITLNFYFGKPFIWCMLHNFGGTLGMHGSLDTLNRNAIEARTLENSTMIGTGLTPEGINQNYIMYDFMSEIGWRTTLVNMKVWIKKYSNRRYGVANSSVAHYVWKLLYRSVYNYKLLYPLRGQYTFIRRPSTQYRPWTWYDITDIGSVWDLLLAPSATGLHESMNYRYDLVDVTRQAFQIIFDHLYVNLIRSYNEKNLPSLQNNSQTMLNLLSDLDLILSTDNHFMLGSWIEDATLGGKTRNEKTILELNARYQITLWGPNAEVLDYAGKQWSGLVEDYYRPRWELFTEFLRKCLVEDKPFNQEIFDGGVFTVVELPFVKSEKRYPRNPQNETYPIAKYCHDKWRRYL